MKALFSKRRKTTPSALRYDLPWQVRARILAAIRDHCGDPYSRPGGFDELLQDVGKRLIKEYGALRSPPWEAVRKSDHPVIEHFFCCRTEEALDFIEASLQSSAYRGRQGGVDEINVVLREHGIGFQLTPYVEQESEKESSFLGRLRKRTVIETEYPRVIRRDENLVHQQIVEPALKLLTNSELRIANTEMLKAHTALRNADFEEAITLCGSAFESVLKTICKIKEWAYDPDRDTCAKLVSICQENGLFPSFYTPIFTFIGTVRNRLGDAHGRGPIPQQMVTKQQAEHMVHMASAHVLLLAKFAGLE